MADKRPADSPAKRSASFGQTARAVLWSFFGVRRRAQYEADAARLNPVHVVIMAIVAAALFIGILLMVIRWVALG